MIDQKDFSKLVQDYQRLVLTVCLAFTRNYFDAEDLAQETFLSAYRHLDGFDGRNPKAWLTSIAANKCRDFLRSPVRRTGSLTDAEMEDIEDKGETPEQQLFQSDTAGRIRSLCRRLREPYRSVAERYFCDSVKLSEMARQTGQNLKTLETRLYRAKKLLRALWEEESA